MNAHVLDVPRWRVGHSETTVYEREVAMGLLVDPETERVAHRLAKLRGTTVEQAVSAAVRAELARAELARAERATDEALTPAQRAKVERTMAMVAALPRLPDDGDDPTACLYDDHGLPR